MSLSYKDLKPADTSRFAAAWMNIENKKAVMSKHSSDSNFSTRSTESAQPATSSKNTPSKTISADSFKTSIARITSSKDKYSNLSASDKERIAACFINIEPPNELKAIMAAINWTKAATDFKPTGKPIKSDSFKTSIGRLQSNFQGASSGVKTSSGRKRKAADTNHSRTTSPPGGGKSGGKKAKTEQDDVVDTVAGAGAPSNRRTGSEEAPNTEQEDAVVSDAAAARAELSNNDVKKTPEVAAYPEELFRKVKAEPELTDADPEDEFYSVVGI